MKKRNRIVVSVSLDKVRSMCIRMGYCTQCNNQQYGDLLALCTDDVDAERIHTISGKIFRYTDVATLSTACNCTPDGLYQAIVLGVLNRCTYLNMATN